LRALCTHRFNGACPHDPLDPASVPITHRQIPIDALAGAGVMSVLPGSAHAEISSGPSLPTGDMHDFDFFVGAWNGVKGRRKKR
jgi:hypothetical protein